MRNADRIVRFSVERDGLVFVVAVPVRFLVCAEIRDACRNRQIDPTL
jgi:hypothetical protein